MEDKTATQLSPVALAFLGDAVFSLYIRQRLVEQHDYKSGMLTKLSSGFVKAVSQSEMLVSLLPRLSDAEREIVRRGRNVHTANKAKNADLSDYKRATALEALLGYLYITEKFDRLKEIMDFCYAVREEKNQCK